MWRGTLVSLIDYNAKGRSWLGACTAPPADVPSLICAEKVWGLGLWVQGPGFRVQSLRFRVEGSGLRVWGCGFGVLGLGFKIEGLGCRV